MYSSGQGNALCCSVVLPWGMGQRGNSAAPLLVPSALSIGLLWEIGSISHCGNPSCCPQTALSSLKSTPLVKLPQLGSQPCPQGCPVPWFFWVGPRSPHLTGLVVLVDFFFNSLVVGIPCSLIFWCFWLFIDFWLVVILLLVMWGSKGFLPMPPSWPERLSVF